MSLCTRDIRKINVALLEISKFKIFTGVNENKLHVPLCMYMCVSEFS